MDKIPKKKLTERRKHIFPTKYNRDFSNDLTSRNLVTKKLIENILNKYIKKEEYYIKDLNDVYLISYYLFHCKYFQSFIKLNNLQIRDFLCLISSAKILHGYDDSLIFKEGDSPLGFYIMIKGGIIAKIAKFSLPDKIDSFFKNEILQEYNLDKDNEEISWFDIKIENKEEDKNDEEIKYKFLYNCRMNSFSPHSCIFQQKHEERLRLSRRMSSILSNTNESNEEKKKISSIMYDEVDLFTYNLNKDDILCFGSVNLFNEYMREQKQIHLTSAYFHNKEKNEENEPNNIILYIHEDNLKDIEKKISALNKERIKFLKNTLTPLKQIICVYKNYFLSTIKLIYINVEIPKELKVKNNIFYLVYEGSCCEKDKKEIIYDKGSFIGLNNLFLNQDSNPNDTITITSKGAEVVLLKIDLNFLSPNNQIKMLKYLISIFTKQYYARKIISNEIMSYENNKIKQKEKDLDYKIQDYLISHGVNNFHRTDRDNIDKNFQIKENSNIKNFNNMYINKKNIFKLLSKSEEKKRELSEKESSKGKNKSYFLKSRENSNSSSPRTSRSSSSTLPILNQTQNSLNNTNQNPINNITFKTNISNRQKSPKKIISRNESNNIAGFNSVSSFVSIYPLSLYDKCLSRTSYVKKNSINKNLLLKNFNQFKNKRKTKFHLLVGNSH